MRSGRYVERMEGKDECIEDFGGKTRRKEITI
jgi:hypothetical protein